MKIWHIWYFKYADFDFDVRNNFHQIFLSNFNKVWALFIWTYWSPAIGKYLIKNNFWNQNRDWVSRKINKSWEFFNVGTNLGLTAGNYLIKVIFEIKIEIGIFEIMNVPNLNKICELLILGTIWVKQVASIKKKKIDIKIQILIFEMSHVPNYNNF